MLPPKLPGHSPPQASCPAGATATRPSIGRKRQLDALARGIGQVEDADVARPIQLPDEAAGRQRIVQDARAIVTGDGADAVGHHRGDRRVAIGSHPHDLHDQRIGRRQAFDVERADLAGPWAARPFVVVARRREGIRLDDVTRLDTEDRVAHREGRCPGSRCEAMHFCVGNRRRARDGGKGQAGDEAHAAHRIAASAARTDRGERKVATTASRGRPAVATLYTRIDVSSMTRLRSHS